MNLKLLKLSPDSRKTVRHIPRKVIEFARWHLPEGTPSLYTCVERGIVKVQCLAIAQKLNTMSLVRARIRAARSGVERTNHERTNHERTNHCAVFPR